MAQLACRPTVKFDGYQWVVRVRFKHYAPIEMRFWTWDAALKTANAYATTGRAR